MPLKKNSSHGPGVTKQASNADSMSKVQPLERRKSGISNNTKSALSGLQKAPQMLTRNSSHIMEEQFKKAYTRDHKLVEDDIVPQYIPNMLSLRGTSVKKPQ